MPVIRCDRRYHHAHWFPYFQNNSGLQCSAMGCESNHKSAGVAVYLNNNGKLVYAHVCEKAGRQFCEANGLNYETGRQQ